MRLLMLTLCLAESAALLASDIKRPNGTESYVPVPNTLVIRTADYTYYCYPEDVCLKNDNEARITIPGTVMMGGGADVDTAFEWQISRAGGGDFVVLRESGTDAYNPYIFALAQGSLRTCATVVFKSDRAAVDPDVLSWVQGAEALFFAGGDQLAYMDIISGTPLAALLRGKSLAVTVGGTSAGLAIQGLWVYTAAFGSAVSTGAMQNPYYALINGSIVNQLLVVPPLDEHRVLTDTHFVTRDRMGRMATFVARIAADGFAGPITEPLRAVGVDEATALLLESDGTLTAVGDGTAYMCSFSPAALGGMTCAQGAPLTLRGVECERLQAAGFYTSDPSADTFDMAAWAGSGVRYSYDIVNGAIIGAAYGP